MTPAPTPLSDDEKLDAVAREWCAKFIESPPESYHVAPLAALLKKYSATIDARDARDAEIARLRTALKDCADDLGTYVEARYENTKNYPSELRRYERDIAPVLAARELLK